MALLFTYGSLKRGFRAHHLLEKARFLGETYTQHAKYKLVAIDDGSEDFAYPAIALNGTQSISGELYEIDEKSFALIGVYEGEDYEAIDIALQDGVTALCFALKKSAYEKTASQHAQITTCQDKRQYWRLPVQS